MITFIIPCAGKGTRLGVPFSKELFPIDKNITLIDKAFSYIEPFRQISQVVIIISEEKTDLVKYLKRYSDEFDIHLVYQKNYFKELSGAIKSASSLFTEKNILLLPDIVLFDKKIDWKIVNLIENDDDVSFLVKNEYDLNILKRMGAMKVVDEKVISTIDKPTEEQIVENEFNSYWVAFAFKYDCWREFLINFEKMQKHEEYDKSLFENKTAIQIEYALDLGVWDNIRKYYNDLGRIIH